MTPARRHSALRGAAAFTAAAALVALAGHWYVGGGLFAFAWIGVGVAELER